MLMEMQATLSCGLSGHLCVTRKGEKSECQSLRSAALKGIVTNRPLAGYLKPGTADQDLKTLGCFHRRARNGKASCVMSPVGLGPYLQDAVR